MNYVLLVARSSLLSPDCRKKDCFNIRSIELPSGSTTAVTLMTNWFRSRADEVSWISREVLLPRRLRASHG